MQTALVGIDIGTTNIKLSAYNEQGEQLRECSCRNEILYQNGMADFDGKDIFCKVISMLRSVVEQGLYIRSIGISSLAESVFPLFGGESGDPGRTMVWFDKRTEGVMHEFLDSIGSGQFSRITGLKPNYLYSIHKIHWYHRHVEETREARLWLPMNSYIVYRLTGGLGMDYSQASRTGALDITRRTWSEEIFRHLPFDAEVFPSLVDCGVAIGELTDEVKRQLGIDYDVPVSLAGHDHICGSFTVAAFRDDVILDSMGTAENISTMIDLNEIRLDEFMAEGIHLGAHVVPEKYYVYKAFDFSGAVLNQVASLLLSKPVVEVSGDDYSLLCLEAEPYFGQDPGTLRVFMSEDNHLAQGYPPGLNILGVGPTTTRGEVFMAAIRHVSDKACQVIRSLDRVLGKHHSVIAIGGGTRNHLLMKDKARNLNRSLFVPQITEAVTLGGALMGAVGAGIFSGHAEAIQAITRNEYEVTVPSS